MRMNDTPLKGEHDVGEEEVMRGRKVTAKERKKEKR